MKLLRRAMLLAIGFVFALFGFTSPAFADFDSDTVQQAVVWVDVEFDGEVEVQYSDNTSDVYTVTVTSYCTGFIVGTSTDSSQIVTAGHCVRYDAGIRRAMLKKVIADQNLAPATGQFDVDKLDWAVRYNDTPTIRIAQPSVIKDAPFDNDGVTAQLIDSQDPEAGDNALVQVAGMDTGEFGLQIAAQAPEIRDEITSVGFPSDTASISDADRQTPTFKEGTISAEVVSKKGVPMLQLDGELITGMSGGPTLNSAGMVVGVNSSGFDDRNQSYISNTVTLRTFLEKNGVKLSAPATGNQTAKATAVANPVEAAPSSQKSDSPITTVVWILVGIFALVIVAGVIGAFWFITRRQRQPVAATSTPNAPPAPLDPPPSDSSHSGRHSE